MKKICAKCGKVFEPEFPWKKYCSAECFFSAQHIQERREPTMLEPKKCEYCGKEFTPARAHQKYCCQKCCHAAHAVIKPKMLKKCEYCGKPFETANFTQKYCNPDCREKAKRESFRKPTVELVPVARATNQLDDWIKRAAEAGMSYGKYRALIERGVC